ncbi:MAG: hypothetical protein J5981_02615, partial [Lachnospira sp.]|nr:hypothetical protein [Lachnospira sp.]
MLSPEESAFTRLAKRFSEQFFTSEPYEAELFPNKACTEAGSAAEAAASLKVKVPVSLTLIPILLRSDELSADAFF